MTSRDSMEQKSDVSDALSAALQQYPFTFFYTSASGRRVLHLHMKQCSASVYRKIYAASD
jgi:hypothetical protein